MSDRSKIEWTDATWNPLRARNPETGKAGHHCVKISPACAHCYAASMNKRLGTNLDYTSSSPTETYLDAEALQQPLAWRRPRRIFVCSMTDLFGEWVPDAFIRRMFAVMSFAGQHTFQVLTKRPERMAAWFANDEENSLSACQAEFCVEDGYPRTPGGRSRIRDGRSINGTHKGLGDGNYWPLPNVQHGVTAENQQYADERIPWLLKTPAAVRFLSCEPLLGPIDAELYLGLADTVTATPYIDWIIAGGESGQQARPMHPAWARGLRDQCKDASVPFFFKQWGEWVPWVGRDLGELLLENASRHAEVMPDGTLHTKTVGHGGELMARLGKKKAGRLLDGREWNEFPQTEVSHASC
jgi:protein gp37